MIASRSISRRLGSPLYLAASAALFRAEDGSDNVFLVPCVIFNYPSANRVWARLSALVSAMRLCEADSAAASEAFAASFACALVCYAGS